MEEKGKRGQKDIERAGCRNEDDAFFPSSE